MLVLGDYKVNKFCYTSSGYIGCSFMLSVEAGNSLNIIGSYPGKVLLKVGKYKLWYELDKLLDSCPVWLN